MGRLITRLAVILSEQLQVVIRLSAMVAMVLRLLMLIAISWLVVRLRARHLCITTLSVAISGMAFASKTVMAGGDDRHTQRYCSWTAAAHVYLPWHLHAHTGTAGEKQPLLASFRPNTTHSKPRGLQPIVV